MTRESKASPSVDTRSVALGAGQLPADSPKPEEACCSACGARLRPGSRFCNDCGTAQVPPAEDEAAAIHSQFGGSSADLAELLSARGQVVSCPRCDELNNASATYCRHCGQLLAAAGASHSATPAENVPRTSETYDERQGRISPPALALRYWPEITMMTLLCVTAAVLWLGRLHTAPATEATRSAASHGVVTAQTAESIVSTAPGEPVAPSAAPGASGVEQEETSPSVSPTGAAQKRAPALEGAHKKVAKTAVQRASAPDAIDELYRHRAAARCAEGLYGLICRQRIRFELCNGKWTQDAKSGMEICRLNP